MFYKIDWLCQKLSWFLAESVDYFFDKRKKSLLEEMKSSSVIRSCLVKTRRHYTQPTGSQHNDNQENDTHSNNT